MDLFEIIEKRRSIRKFKPVPIKEEKLKKILEAGRLAPSGGNRQPWHFVVVKDVETKKALAIASNNQQFIADADTVIVALGDTSTTKSKPPYTLATTRIAHLQDPIIAVEHMILAATAFGYGTCWIGAFNGEEVKKIIKAPDNFVVVALLPIGVPNEKPQPRPRKAFTEIFSKGVYGNSLQM